MMLGSEENWIIAFIFGMASVGMNFWPRCDDQFEPRLSKSYGRYVCAKCAYVGAMIIAYVILSLVPGAYYLIPAFFPDADRVGR